MREVISYSELGIMILLQDQLMVAVLKRKGGVDGFPRTPPSLGQLVEREDQRCKWLLYLFSNNHH
jgi:hypothetical protein